MYFLLLTINDCKKKKLRSLVKIADLLDNVIKTKEFCYGSKLLNSLEQKHVLHFACSFNAGGAAEVL